MTRAFASSCVALLTISSVASAEDPESCSIAYARGQEERLAGRLYNARAAFRACATTTCAALASDCGRWVKEVEADLPTILVKVRGEEGKAVENLQVAIDGETIAAASLSAPIVLEAGPHELRFDAPGYEAVRLERALRPSDREVLVEVTLRPPRPPVTVSRPRPIPTASWVLTGVGAVALGGSVYFGVRANGEYRDLEQRCAPKCAPSTSDGMWTHAVIADVALAGAVVALAASAIIYITRPASPLPAQAMRLELAF